MVATMNTPLRLCLWTLLTTGPLLAVDNVLVVGPRDRAFQTTYESIRREIHAEAGNELQVIFREVNRDTDQETFESYYRETKPRFLVLMDNSAVDHWRRYQEARPDENLPPAIACIGAFLSEYTIGMRNVFGINYEVPLLTSVTELRDKVTVPIRTVGVVYRDLAQFENFIQRQKDLALRENIILEAVPLDSERVSQDLDRGLRTLIRRKKIDALWLINDNRILTEDNLTEIVLPRLRFFKKPVIVNIQSFLQPGLGNFGYLPDHQNLGYQVAGLVFDLMERGMGSVKRFQEPEGVSYLNIPFAQRYLGLKRDKIAEIDHPFGEQ